MQSIRFFRNAAVLALAALAAGVPARADYLFEGYLDPNHPGYTTDYSAWDVFYSPYGGANKPDFAATYGSYSTASAAGVTPPANSSPTNPSAYWDSRNPTITQTGTSTAFIIGAGISGEGNIYSYAAPTSFQLADTTSYNAGLVLFQFQTQGSLVNFSSIQLQYTDSSGQMVSLSPEQYLTEYQSAAVAGQGFTLTNRLALEWNLTGLDVSSFNIVFSAAEPSMSFQQASLDTAATYSSTVPQARTWMAAGSGAWSNGANWWEGTSSVENGNVNFNPSGAAAITLDGSHTVGQIHFENANNVTLNPSGGAALTSNTGIVTDAAATGTYTINADYVLGAYNVFNLAAGEVVLNGTVSGNYGFFKEGDGTLVLNGNNTFIGGIGVEGGTLRLTGANAYAGGTSVLWGTLEVAGNAVIGTAGPLGNDASTINLGADSDLYANQAISDTSASLIIDGAYTVGRQIALAGGTFEKILGAENASGGAAYTGAIGLSTATDLHLRTAAAGDTVTFSGGIAGGLATGIVTIDGPGTVILAGTGNSYTSDTAVATGTLKIASGGSLTSNGKVTVAAGSRLLVDGTLGGAGTLELHGTLGGAGTVSRAFTVDATSILAPGEGTGTLSTVAETWAAGGTLRVNVADAAGAAGTGTNLLQVNGTITITATAADPFHVDIASLGLDGQPGAAANFDPSRNYTWEIAGTTGGVAGFNAADFDFDGTAFTDALGTFSLSVEGNDLYLTYTAEAVPEPSVTALLLLGLGGLLAAVHFRGGPGCRARS